MLPARIQANNQPSARAIEREILLWTTKDGREIPLDEMSDEHIANAVRVLTEWRTRSRKRDRSDPILRDLTDAIARFKTVMRKRRKLFARETSSRQFKLQRLR